MKEFNKIIIILLLMMQISFAWGQNSIDIKGYTTGQLKKFGKNADRLGDVYTAVDFYEEYCKRKPGDDETNYRLAELLFISRDYTKAEKTFSKVYKDKPETYPQALYYQGLSLKSQGKYTEAKEILAKFQRKLKLVKDGSITSSQLREDIAGCEIADSLVNHPQKIKIEPMGRSVNSPHVDLSPIPVNDSLFYYASLRSDSSYFFERDDSTRAIPSRQFYVAKKSGNDWNGGKLMPGPFNIPGVETGNGAFSRDGNRFYFTRGSRDFQGKMICAIYVSHHLGVNKWSEPEKLNSLVNDPNYTSTQPTVGYTARAGYEVVYFVSDRPNGKGGMDIWYTIYDPRKKEYLAPKNAGNKINTSRDEITPFYDLKTRTLYYSSNGHINMGGFDVFKSLGELRKWYPSVIIGSPVNSSYDDLYFTIGQNREDGLLVSNRPGMNSLRNPSCCDDIYQYRWTEFIHLAVSGNIYPAEKGKINKDMDQSQLMAMKDKIKPMKGAILSLYMIDKKTKEKIFMDRDTTKEDGFYKFDLLPDCDYKFEMEGFQYFNEQVNLSTDGINFTYTIEMPPIWVNVIPDKPMVLSNVYYEFEKSDLSQLAKKSIDTSLLELMRNADDIIVEISSHTDSVGTYEFNKKLSQERADNVVNYLISKGIARKRLVAKGYGPDRPIAPNSNPDGSDNPAGREKNRRTEFRIIGTLSSMSEIDSDEISE